MCRVCKSKLGFPTAEIRYDRRVRGFVTDKFERVLKEIWPHITICCLGGYVERRSKTQQNLCSNYQMASISKLKFVLMLCWTPVQTRVPATWFKVK